MNHVRQAVIDYTYPIYTEQSRWFSKAPDPISPFANLINTMDTGCWVLTMVSLACVSFVLVITVNVGTRYGVKKTDNADIALTPLVMMVGEGNPNWFNFARAASSTGFSLVKRGRAGQLLLLTWSFMGMIIMFGFTCNLRAIYMKVY